MMLWRNLIQKEIEEETKKSKMLGNVRTGLMAGATVTSAVSTGTSIGATVNADKLAKKMSDCNQKLYELKIAKSELEALGPPTNQRLKLAKMQPRFWVLAPDTIKIISIL